MAGGVGGALARGLEAGWGMGMEQSRFEESKRRSQVEEARQADADRRAQAREDRAQRDADWNRQTAALGAENTLAQQELNEVVGRAQATRAAGGELTPEQAQEYGAARTRVADVRQRYRDLLSNVQTGRVDPMKLPDRDFAGMIQMNTGFHADELKALPDATENLRSGMATGNMPLALQGANVLLGPVLRRGLGEESPHGGTIVRKEIVNAIPAQDANGVLHPDKVYPVVRVFVQRPDENGQGVTLYYDAPLTKNGSTDPGDPVVPVSLDRLTDFSGNAGTLAAALQHPEAAAKFENGRKEAGGEIDRWLQELSQAAPKPAPKIVGTGGTGGIHAIEVGPDGKPTARTLVEPQAKVSGGVQSFEARVQAIKDLGLSPEAEAAAIKDLTLRGGGKISGDVPVKGKGVGGGTAAGGSGSSTAGPAPSDDHNLLAAEWLVSGKAPFRGAKQLLELDKTRTKLMKQAGLTIGDVIRQGQDFQLTDGAAKEVEKMYAAVESFSQTAQANMKVLEDLSAKLPRSNIPIISKGQLAVERWSGNPVMSQYEGALQSVRTEIARIITQPRLTGQLTDTARKEVEHFMHGDMTNEQLLALMKTLRTEMSNREAGIVSMRNALQTRRTGMADRIGGEGQATPAPAPAGQPVRTATNPQTGEKLQLVNGQWVPLR